MAKHTHLNIVLPTFVVHIVEKLLDIGCFDSAKQEMILCTSKINIISGLILVVYLSLLIRDSAFCDLFF